MDIASVYVLPLALAAAGVCSVQAAAAERAAAAPEVFYQAHRGGLLEVPENTLAAYRHAWSCPGAIPEVDVCVTKDGAMVCMHDDTAERTTDAPKELATRKMGELTLEQVRQWDAGVKFDARFAGEKVPTLIEVFEEMKGWPERQVYLDLKDVNLDELKALIEKYGLLDRIIFVHGLPSMCKKLQVLFQGARTMTWLSGAPEKVRARFAALAKDGFPGISQIQLHLETVRTAPEIEYAFDADFLREAAATARAAGAELQVRPFDFDRKSLEKLRDLGIRWFVTDAPKRFADALGLM